MVEGERDVEALEALGEVATCNPGGAGKWRTEFTEALRDADVLIVRDDDKPGRQHGQAVARELTPVANSVTLLRPAEGCNDTAEHLDQGFGLDDFVKLTLRQVNAGSEDAGDRADVVSLPTKSANNKSPKPKASAALVDLVTGLCETFGWEDQVHASWLVDGHRETWPLNSNNFKGWLSGEYWVRQRSVLGSTAIGDALRVIEALARSSGNKKEVHTRVALGQNGAVYVDLLDAAWRAIKFTAEGWTIVNRPAVRFIRRPGMLPLPVPRGAALWVISGSS